jgi:hypothetical protein
MASFTFYCGIHTVAGNENRCNEIQHSDYSINNEEIWA